jgi:hypothetical protein
MQEPIPEDVKQFILDSIDSVAQLEALLLLRSDLQADWTTRKVAERLYLSEQETIPLLARLCTDGLLTVTEQEPPVYRYRPDSSELRHMVDRLAETYSTHLVPITNLVHSKARTRLQKFADAFKFLRKEK